MTIGPEAARPRRARWRCRVPGARSTSRRAMAFRLAAGGWTPTPIGARTRVISRARRTTPAWRCAIGWISERSEPQPDRHRSGVGGKAFSPREADRGRADLRSEEHTSELQSLMRISYAVFCLKKK